MKVSVPLRTCKFSKWATFRSRTSSALILPGSLSSRDLRICIAAGSVQLIVKIVNDGMSPRRFSALCPCKVLCNLVKYD